MPGMNRSIQDGNSLIVSNFHSALLHQLLIVLVLGLLCAIAFNVVRTVQFRRLANEGHTTFPGRAQSAPPEPPARRILRIGFGLLWILDGLLQAQSSMPLGLPSGVIQPGAAGSPDWVQHLVNSGVTIWNNHPVEAAAATVWIQVGLGLWLLVAPRGRWSRLGGLAGAGWGLLVWVFGESFGGLFAPGASWLFGAPGAVLFYVVAGVLVALDERAFQTPRLGRIVLTIGGAFVVALAVLQAWPGRGFWQGRGGGLATMVQQMSSTSQPGFLSSWLRSFGSLVDAHGWGVNLFVVVALAVTGALMMTGQRGLARAGLVGFVVLCLADWVLVQDLGFFGGLGTDPNSMLPMALLFVGGYVAEFRLPVPAEAAAAPDPVAVGDTVLAEPATGPEPQGHWWDRATLGYLIRSLAAVAALGIVLVGTAPMARAAVNGTADPILTEALDGTPNALDTPAPPFSLTDQNGLPVSLASLRGHVIALTFLDPVCTSDCPTIAQEFRLTDQALSSESGRVDYVAIVANPIYRSRSFTDEFDRQEGLTHLTNWLYLTGSVAALERIWNSYGIQVSNVPDGAMTAHSDLAYIIDAQGRERDALIDDPGPTRVFASSFSSLLASRIQQVLPS
jgi:cytochrome oxidase Cu insertion factor (SCO1/SenC/PrrC family)